MNSYKIEDLKPNATFSEDVLLDKAFLLVPASCALTDEQIADIKEWGFSEVYTSSETKVVSKKEDEKKKEEIKAKVEATLGESTEVDVSEFGIEVEDETPKPAAKPAPSAPRQTFSATPPKSQQTAPAAARPSPTAAVNATEPVQSKPISNTKEELEAAKKTYNEFHSYINKVYTFYATNKTFDVKELNEKVPQLCAFVKTNRSYVLRIISSQETTGKNFLISHCMRSTVVSITIAMQLRMPDNQITELATACILHELGMIFLPPQLYMGSQPLTPPEKLMMTTHPIVTYNIVKKANFSLNIQLAVLEHHERMNGSGYPRHVTGDKISLYAKIIAVACSFEAITAPREYKEERTTFEALLEMLRNANHQYDETVIKALLFSISIYPIGIFVYLSNGKIAQVVDVSPGNPKTPFVQILGSENTETVKVDGVTLKIIRVLNKKEMEDTQKTLQQMAEKTAPTS